MEATKTSYSLVGTAGGKPIRVAVPEGDLEIGRSHERGLMLADEEASRLHCVVHFSGDRITVEDRSRNGTFVNGVKIAQATELKVGDVLTIGTSRLELRAVESGQTTMVARGSAPSAAAGGIAEELKPGDMVDRYRIVRRIGRGGMGTVYEAVHTGLDLPRALKVLTLPDDPGYAAFRDKFLDEGKMLARLRHENITQVHDAAYDEKTRTLFFVMDLVLYDDGRPCTLEDVAYDECDVVSWFASLASALDYIHAQGIVHSDIKLQNVLVSPGQKIKLADFGVAHLLSGKMRSDLRAGGKSSSDGTIGYTEHYVAPEVLKPGGMPSVASDVYALGVMLVRLLTNKWYDGRPAVLAEIAAKRSLNWRPVLAQMLCVDPKRRPTSLVKLVQQLRHGSKAPVRRKFQLEGRRRRNQKIRLTRVQTGKTNGLRTTSFAADSKREKVVFAVLLALAAAVAAIGGCWTYRTRVAANAAAAVRMEALREAKAQAEGPLQKARADLEELADRSGGAYGAHLREFGFVEGLSYANVTGLTDRVRADLRNEALVRYGDVLKAVAAVRAAAGECRSIAEPCLRRIRGSARIETVKESVDAFEKRRLAAGASLDEALAAERKAWSAYEEAKARVAKEEEARARLSETRRASAGALRRMLADEAGLKSAPERTEAAGKFAAGDRLARVLPVDFEAATRSYADAVACLSNGCARLRAEREELAAITNSFRQLDDGFRTVQLANFRRGQSSLAVVAAHAKDIGARFSGRWETACRFPTNRGTVAECAFCLQAHAAYFGYLAKTLPGSRDGLAFALTPNGVEIDNGRIPYQLGWNEIFSPRKMDLRVREAYRRMVLDVVDVPMDLKASARGLLGRWMALAVLKGDLNTDGQAARLVEAVGRDGSDVALVCARRELPERFAAPEPAAESAPAEANRAEEGESEAEPSEDFPEAAPALPTDASADRVIFFNPVQGLNIEAFGRDGAEIARCARVRNSRAVRFELREAVVFAPGAGARSTAVDVPEGRSFEAGSGDDERGTVRYHLLAWIDNALGDGRPLVLIRSERIR